VLVILVLVWHIHAGLSYLERVAEHNETMLIELHGRLDRSGIPK
jgi:hypothetical protein